MGFDNECIVNIQTLPGEYFCPVCRTLVYPNEALQTQCTHLYCKPCLAYTVATTRACPYDGYLVTEADAKPLIESNKAIAEAIDKIQVHCLYHRSGCQWQGSLSECITHCASCTFGNSPVVCNRCGTQIVHRQVQEHAQICPGVQPQQQQQQAGAAQPVSSDQNQIAVQAASQASQLPSAQSNMAPISSLSTAPANVAASAPPAAAALPAAAIPGQALPMAQAQGVAQAPTSEQWYQQQQQQLQYQQYYQQYPGYDPYQQQAQFQQQAFLQYPQSQMQSFPQATQAMQHPPAYAQSQPQTLPQPQALQQAQPQPLQQQAIPQPQIQGQPQTQMQLHPYGHTPQMQVPVNPQQSLAPVQQPQPQMQPQPNPQAQLQLVASQQTGNVHSQTHLPGQHLQAQAHVHPQHQQLMQQQHPPAQLPQPPAHPQHQAQVQTLPRPQLQQYPPVQAQPQHPQMQTQQQHPHLQPLPQPQPQIVHQAHLPAQSMPQQPAGHGVSGHLPYPQPQQTQQMLPGPPQQRPAYMQPPQQGMSHQMPQHPVQVHSQPPPQQSQTRPAQQQLGMQAQPGSTPPPQMGHHPNQVPSHQQIQQQHSGMHPPVQHQGLAPPSGRHQSHPQQGSFPSQNSGMPHSTQLQGGQNMQQYPPTHSQVQQNALVTQGMPITQGQVMLQSGSQVVPGESPVPSRIGRSEQNDGKFDGDSEAKGISGSTSTAHNNIAELSGFPSQKQDSDNKQDKGEAGMGDSLNENKISESPMNRATKEELHGKPPEQSEGTSLELTDGIDNKPDKTSQVAGEEDGQTERETMTRVERDESDKSKMPPPTSVGTISGAQSFNRGSETSGQASSQQGGYPLPSNQAKASPTIHYHAQIKGDQRPPSTPASEVYPGQMAPLLGPPDMHHVASQRPLAPERVSIQNVPHAGSDYDRRFQEPQAYSMPPPGHAQMGAPGGFAEHVPPPGPFQQQSGSGFLDPGLQRGSAQLPPPQGQIPLSHVGPKMHSGPLPAPPMGGPLPGPFDSREAMMARGPPPFQDGQMGMPRPPHPMLDDKFPVTMPGSFDSRPSDLRPPVAMEYGSLGQFSGSSSRMAKPNGLPGKFPDLGSHGPLADRFQSFPDDRYKSLPDEGFKPFPDENFRPFPVDPMRRMREFEEDLKQFPRHPMSGGEGMPKMDNFSRPLDRGTWGPDTGSRPFDKTVKPFGLDGGPNFDSHAGAMASRMSDGVFGDRHPRDDISKRPDFNQFENPPFGIGVRDLSELASNRFEGLTNQSRLRDYTGRDQSGFGERSRSFGLNSEPFGSVAHVSRFPVPSAPFDASETSRMIEQFGSGNPKINEHDGPDYVTGKSRVGEPFGNHMPTFGSGSPGSFHNRARMDEPVNFGFLPAHLRNRESAFGGNFPTHGFSKEAGSFNSDDMYSSDPSQKRKPGSSGWCRICKIDCETVEGLDLHSQTREHQKVAMDIVLTIKKNSSKKLKSSEDNILMGEMNMARRTGFEVRGNRP